MAKISKSSEINESKFLKIYNDASLTNEQVVDKLNLESWTVVLKYITPKRKEQLTVVRTGGLKGKHSPMNVKKENSVSVSKNDSDEDVSYEVDEVNEECDPDNEEIENDFECDLEEYAPKEKSQKSKKSGEFSIKVFFGSESEAVEFKAKDKKEALTAFARQIPARGFASPMITQRTPGQLSFSKPINNLNEVESGAEIQVAKALRAGQVHLQQYIGFIGGFI